MSFTVMDELISVIINVYNCRTYLQKTLDSVREQSYRNLEVILVDDCSTDGSGEFCDEYCKQDGRFRVIHHEKNTGVSGPRNTGLRVAKGDYVYFMDGDDYIHVEAIEALADAIKETNLELAAFDLYKDASVDEDNHCPREKRHIEIVSTTSVLSSKGFFWIMLIVLKIRILISEYISVLSKQQLFWKSCIGMSKIPTHSCTILHTLPNGII